jgi:hypothetical protein
MEQAISNTTIYVGFTKQKYKIWTIEFELKNPPNNSNCHFFVQNFKIISIEDFDGKLYRKDNNYAIGKNYYLRKHPVKTFLSKTNLMFDKFYNQRCEDFYKYTGQVTVYHANGNIALQYFLNNGIIEGNYIAIDKFGNETEIAFFVNGKRHGKTTFNGFYFDDIKIYSIECEFDMSVMTSYNIKFTREEAIEIIHNNKYEYGKNIAIFNESTGKYSCDNKCISVEWTEIDGEIDTYSIKLYDDYAQKYLKYITDIPNGIRQI